MNLPIANIPVIAVASGKGGVGKTTVAVNLALALAERGKAVGLVDADLYGPDVPRMVGLRRQKGTSSLTVLGVKGSPGARLEAIERHGIQLISAGFLLGEDQGISVDAAIARLIIRRLIEDTIWKGVEYLIIDLPPGTADIQQFIFALRRRPVFPLIVVTPQVVAHQDARRLIAELSRRRMQTIGGVENMSGSICIHCGEVSPLFSPAIDGENIWNGTRKLASIPFSYQAAQDADKGLPVLLTRVVPEQVAAYELIATEVDRHIESAMKGELQPFGIQVLVHAIDQMPEKMFIGHSIEISTSGQTYYQSNVRISQNGNGYACNVSVCMVRCVSAEHDTCRTPPLGLDHYAKSPVSYAPEIAVHLADSIWHRQDAKGQMQVRKNRRAGSRRAGCQKQCGAPSRCKSCHATTPALLSVAVGDDGNIVHNTHAICTPGSDRHHLFKAIAD